MVTINLDINPLLFAALMLPVIVMLVIALICIYKQG